MKNKKGLTLLEIIIVCVIMTFLLTTIYALLIKGFYSIRFNSHKMSSMQTGLTLLNRIFMELIISNYKYISVDDGSKSYSGQGDLLAFPYPYDRNDTLHRDEYYGNMLWYKYFFYYKEGSKIWKKIIHMGKSSGKSTLVSLEKFHFPDGLPLSPTYNLIDYKDKKNIDIEGPIPSAYNVKSVKFSKKEENKSVIIELEIIDPKDEGKFKSTKHTLIIIPKNN